MSIKELIELLQTLENQESKVFEITVGVYKDCINIQYDDGREDELIYKKVSS